MYLAMHNWMRAEPVETAIARIAALGYRALEISGEPERHNVASIREALKTHDIRCFGAVTLMLGERNLVAADEAQRQRSIQYVNECITLVKELGGEEISIVPGTVGKIAPDATPEEEWRWAVDALKEIYPHAQASGVRMGIEPINRFETYFVNRAAQALALAKEVGPDCGVCLDIFHMNMEEADPLQAIRDCADRLVDFHVADNNRFAPGMGQLDWAQVIGVLKEIGYDGPLSVEFCPPVDRTPANPYPGSIDTHPVGVPEEQRKFIEEHGSSTVTLEFFEHLVKTSAETLLPLL